MWSSRLVPLLAFVMLVCLAGCGASGDGKPTVAFVTNNPFEFWTYAHRGCEAAEKDFDIHCEFEMPPRGTAAEQKQIVEDLLAKGVQAIAISVLDAENQAPFLNDVAGQIPLITQDSDLPEGSQRRCYIGTDNYQAGRAAGVLVKEVMPEGGKVIIYVGKLDVQNAVQRRQGVMDELAGEKDAQGPQLGKYELLDTMTDDAKQEKCKANVEDSLVKYHGDVDQLCLVGLWAYNPPAMLAAVKDANLLGKVRMVGFDENAETLQGIADGHIYGTIVQQPYEFGYQAVKLMSELVRGNDKNVPEGGILYIPHKVIKKDNVEAFSAELAKLRGE